MLLYVVTSTLIVIGEPLLPGAVTVTVATGGPTGRSAGLICTLMLAVPLPEAGLTMAKAWSLEAVHAVSVVIVTDCGLVTTGVPPTSTP
jgi:hypothetical protein